MSRKRRQDIFLEDVTIENVAAEGKAFAHVFLQGDDCSGSGRILFVPFAVPGDVVDVQVTRKKKNYLEGRIINVKKLSQDHLEPFCEHFGVCGGCKWQTLPYDIQLQAKQRQVYDQLTRIGHLELPQLSPIIGSQNTKFYRNKLEYSASDRRWMLSGENPELLSDAEKAGLGFHVGKFFDKVLDINRCWLQSEPSNEIRLFVKHYCTSKSLSF